MKTLRVLCVLILCVPTTLNTGQAFAQIPGQATNGAVVVATCGIAPTNYPAAGARGPHTVDVNGNECTSATVATGALATSANQTNGTQQTKVVDGSGNVLPTTASGPTSATNADSVYSTGGDAGATAQVSVGTSATLVLASRVGGRRAASVTKIGTTATMFCGYTSGVTTGTGDYMANTDGYSILFFTNTAIYCISTSGSQTVSVNEVY